jgi:DNA-binding NtrC family response regulator
MCRIISGMVIKAIAIIDDEVDLVDLFQEILVSDGYKVCTFIDPIQAFTTLEKNPRIRIDTF